MTYIPLEQHRDAPDSGKTDDGIDNSRHDRSGTENPGNEIELEQTNQKPIQSTDNHQNQCDCIHEINSFHQELVCDRINPIILLFFWKNFDFKAIESDGIHEIGWAENDTVERAQILNMLV